VCKKNNFQIFLLFILEMAVLSVFLQKKGLDPLGVKGLNCTDSSYMISKYE